MSLHMDAADAAHQHLDSMSASAEREAANHELLREAFTDALCNGRAMEAMSTPGYRQKVTPLRELVHDDKELGQMLVQLLAAAHRSADPVLRMPAQAAIVLLANEYADMHAADVEVD